MPLRRSYSILAVSVILTGIPVRAEEPAHFHHVRLNATQPAKSMAFYQKHLGAVPIKYRGGTNALFVERSFLLFNKVDSPPPTDLVSGIWHIGWGGVDVPNEYRWLARQGVKFHTTPQPLPGFDNHYMYLWGPDQELIEVNTMGHHRFAHVHFFADDVNATCEWYAQHLGLRPRRAKVPRPKGDPETLLGIWMNFITCDNVQMIFFGKPDFEKPVSWWRDPPLRDIQPTQGRAIDHVAFSYREIDPVYARMKEAGVAIVAEPATCEPFGFRSFLVEGPDRVLIEIVEEKPIPEGIWDAATSAVGGSEEK